MTWSGGQDFPERVAISPEEKGQQDRNDDGDWQTAGV